MPTPRQGYVWSGSEWTPLGPTVNIAPTYVQSSAPSSPTTGEIWVDTSLAIPTIDSATLVTTNPSGNQTIISQNTITTPLVLKGASGQTNNLLDFKDNAGNTLTSVSSLGNIDIAGSVSPTLRLIETSSLGNPKIQLLDITSYNSPTEGFELLYESSTGNSYLNNIYSAGSIIFKTAATEKMRIDNSGGILMSYLKTSFNRAWGNYPSITIHNDTTNGPQAEFRIHGDVGASGGDFSVVTRCDGGYVTGSDIRRKRNISDIDNPLKKVKELTGKVFNIINDSGEEQKNLSYEENGKKFGLLAQDVINVIPEAVKYYEEADKENEIGYASAYSIDYASLIPLLIEAIKELSNKVDRLEKDIA